MVYVDFSNPYLRNYLERYGEAHRKHLDGIRERVPEWIAKAREAEARMASRGGVARPLAAVLDIDEVVLANIHMNAFQAPGSEPIDFHACDYYLAPNGRPWPRDDLRLNPLLPGARELMETLCSHGAEIFFITGRLESIRDETVENFVFVGLAGPQSSPDSAGSQRPQNDVLFSLESISSPGGRLIMCPDAEYPPPGQTVRPYKESRRRLIQETHRIVVNVGDQISDLGLYGDVQVHVPNIFYWTP
jgi:predicted secreted acid phosphatase